jgi:hypothetical protein
MKQLTQEEIDATRTIAEFLHSNDISADKVYLVRWENSKGFWLPCLECLKFQYSDGDDDCEHIDLHYHEGHMYYDNIRCSEVYRIIDLITLEVDKFGELV